MRSATADDSLPAASRSQDSGRPTRDIVLFVCLARGLGGSTRSLLTILSHLGDDVESVIAAPREGPFPVATEALGVSRLVIPNPKGWTRRPSRAWAAMRLVVWMWRRRKRILAVHANGPEELNLIAPAAVVAKVPVAVWSHARDVSPWMRRLAPGLRRFAERHEVRWAAVSPLARRVLIESGMAGSEHITIIPNPIDPTDVLATHRTPSDVPVVGYLGSDAPYKGFQLLPEVIRRLEGTPLRWMLFTDERSPDNTAAWADLRAAADGSVVHVGKLRDVRQAYAQCDIVFIPSLDESFCRVAAEAMLNGLPVVASHLEPVHHLLGGDRAGLLFKVGDAAEAAAAVHTVALDATLRARLGAAGRERARAYEPSVVIEKLRGMYGVDTREPKMVS